MTDYGRNNDGNVDAIKSDATEVPHVDADGGCTLGVGTYYFPVGSGRSSLPVETNLVSAHLKWAAAVAATITVETSNFPPFKGSAGLLGGPTDVSDISATAGDWILENPSTAIVGVTGGGNSATAATVTAGGTNAGGCMYHLGNFGCRRVRIKVVTTVGGVVRCSVHGKD